MRKILIVDTNYGFLSDVESRLILDEIENVEISTRNKIDGIHDEIESLRPDELIIFANLLNSHPSWDFGVPVKTYARDASGIGLSSEKGFPCYGVVKNAGDLITAIEQNKTVQVEAPKSITEEPAYTPQTQNTPQPAPAMQPQEMPMGAQAGYGQTMIPNGFVGGYSNPYGQQPQGQPYPYPTPQPQPQPQPAQGTDINYLKENREAILAALLSGQGQAPVNPYGQQPQTPYQGQTTPYQPQPNPAPYQGGYGNNPATGYGQQGNFGQYPNGYLNGYPTPNGINPNEYEVARDMGMIKRKAKVISTYSAKGGVGKTTVSCELATFLALTAHGRGKYRVCIADFNIDFGNVLNTLDFDPKKACMTHWAADIRERIARGEKPENIQYTQAQIESYLQHKEKDGLYALLAPLTNLDSMRIKAVEVDVMLRNLTHNGGFDFIVCDTGNNTRDATYLALNNSDIVFLILTQSVNAANSNQSFLMTMLPSNFDMSKIKTIINMVKGEKEVGASVQEVKEAIVNPATRRPFECVAEIKDLNDVRNAENIGEPLVYKSVHEFTQGIAQIAKYVIGEEFVLPEMPKQNLFSELLGKLTNFRK